MVFLTLETSSKVKKIKGTILNLKPTVFLDFRNNFRNLTHTEISNFDSLRVKFIYLSGTMGGIFDDISLLYFYCYSSAQIMACFVSYFAFRRFLVSFDLSFVRNEFSKI